MKKYGKFTALIAIILGVLAWLAVNGAGEAKQYYRTIAELKQMGAEAGRKNLRVAGDVEANSIVRKGSDVTFVLVAGKQKLNVIYSGREPLPDTFRDGAQAVSTGKMGPDAVFHSTRVEAKCASKYAPKPGEMYKAADVAPKT